jgi:hypothetical protein
MGLSVFESVHWALSTLLEAAIVFLAMRRQLFRRLPFFTLYLWALVINEVVMWSFYRFTGFRSHASFSAYWTMQAIQVTCRGVAVYEVCRFLLRPYKGIWRFCRPFLLAVATALIVEAVFRTRERAHHLAATILAAESGLELAIVAILLFGLAFSRYYVVKIDRFIEWIGLGLGFYSAVQVVNNTILQRWLVTYFPLWENFRHFSFNIATICWGIALLKPLPALRPSHTLLSSSEYESLAPEVTARLRELNARLLEMWK